MKLNRFALVSVAVLLLMSEVANAGPAEPPRPASDKTLRQCEKELARDGLQQLVASGLVKVEGGALTGGSYKAYKLSNTLQQKDVEKFLKEHGLPKAIRTTFAPHIKSLVRGKVFRGGSLVGILVGGAMMIVLGPNDQAQASTSVGPSVGRQDVVPPRFSDEDFGPLEDSSAPHPTDEATDRAIIAPMVQLGESEEFENMIRREFGSKDWLALWFADRSIAKFNGEQGGVIVFSTLQTCSDEDHPNEVFQKICKFEPSAVECLLKQERVRDTLKNMLSRITISNDHISWDASKFED
jgi:hypothetical protein